MFNVVDKDHEKVKFDFLKEDQENNTIHRDVMVRQEVIILNPNILDGTTGKVSEIPGVCVYVEADPMFPFLWYYFAALNPDLNVYTDPKFSGSYHCILRSIDPKFRLA